MLHFGPLKLMAHLHKLFRNDKDELPIGHPEAGIIEMMQILQMMAGDRWGEDQSVTHCAY